MYGLWYIFFGFLALVILGIILIIIACQYDMESLYITGCILLAIGCIVSFILIWFCIFSPIGAAESVYKYTELYSIYISQVELVNKSPDSLAALAQNQELIANVMKYNEWLSSAKANQNTYGCFSEFYNVDLSKLSLISLV